MTETNRRVPASIDAAALTTASWITLTQVAFPISLGYSEREVARSLGWPTKVVAARLDDLRDELQANP